MREFQRRWALQALAEVPVNINGMPVVETTDVPLGEAIITGGTIYFERGPAWPEASDNLHLPESGDGDTRDPGQDIPCKPASGQGLSGERAEVSEAGQ